MDRFICRLIAVFVLVTVGFTLLGRVVSAEINTLTISTPPVAVTATNQPLTLASATFDAITLDGTPAGNITLSVTNGDLTLAQTVGLSFSSGDGTNDATMTLSGNLAAINAALDGLQFTPTSSFAGRAVLTISDGSTSATLEIAVNQTIDGEAARSALLNGVSIVHGGVQPGNLVAFGPTAFVVNHFDDNNAWFAVATLGQGRIIAVPDHQGLDMDRWGSEGDSAELYKNGISWLADSAALDVAIVTLDGDITAWLVAEGYTNVTTSSTATLANDLISAEILISGRLGSSPSQATIDTYRDFLLAGGNLFIADYGIGYSWW